MDIGEDAHNFMTSGITMRAFLFFFSTEQVDIRGPIVGPRSARKESVSSYVSVLRDRSWRHYGIIIMLSW